LNVIDGNNQKCISFTGGMELSELETIKNIYGSICVALFIFWAFQPLGIGRKPPTLPITTHRLLAMGIVGWSGYISLTSNAESIDFLSDWLITVPLIFLSLSYNGLSEGWKNNTLLLGFISIAAILSARNGSVGDLDKGLIQVVIALIWLVFWVRGLGLSFRQSSGSGSFRLTASGSVEDYSQFSMYEKATYILLLAYPILFFLAGSTVFELRLYEGSILDDWGLHFYSYVTLLILLSCVCKIGLSVYHVMTDSED